ncbi:hypothetical protein AQUCO_01400046v1 [Aquilegia coerulea]|uniref:Uncharacterized protein n=1 Tax=Aquilegia coerulea TaxID=218851 RepID=A0A2G5DU81_AQUCA|nr:hypothetical protein AQUCO_01400046v1 [Aquilegia coerulea]
MSIKHFQNNCCYTLPHYVFKTIYTDWRGSTKEIYTWWYSSISLIGWRCEVFQSVSTKQYKPVAVIKRTPRTEKLLLFPCLSLHHLKKYLH